MEPKDNNQRPAQKTKPDTSIEKFRRQFLRKNTKLERGFSPKELATKSGANRISKDDLV